MNLSSEASNGPANEAAISAQQLLYTIIAAAPKIDSLQLQIAGVPVTTLWGTPLGAAANSSPPASPPSDRAWHHHRAADVAGVGPRLDHCASRKRDRRVVVPDRRRGDSVRGHRHWQILRNGGVLEVGVGAGHVQVRPIAEPGA